MTYRNIKSVSAYYGIAIESIDCDKEKNLSLMSKYLIMEAPTILLFNGKHEVFRASGLKSLESLMRDFEEIINK